MADVAFTFHFPSSELMEMEIEGELLEWHQQIERINKHLRQQ